VLDSALGGELRGFNRAFDRDFAAAIRTMQARGATIVRLPALESPGFGEADLAPIEQQFGPELDAWFATAARTAPVHSLRQVVAVSSEPALAARVRVLPLLRTALGLPPPSGPVYERRVAAMRRVRAAFLAMFRRYRLTAITFAAGGCPAPPLPGMRDPTYRCQGGGSLAPILSPITGLPVLTIPTGRLPGHQRAAIDLLGPAWSEGPLLRLGYAFQRPNRRSH
jgi:amidase